MSFSQEKDSTQNRSNYFVLYAVIREKKVLRYTPAGIPVQELVLFHESEQCNAGLNRKLAFDCPAIAYGKTAEELSATPLESNVRLEGYWAPQYSARSRWLLHIDHFSCSYSNDTAQKPIKGVQHGIC
jgi:primosomal replication protein N